MAIKAMPLRDRHNDVTGWTLVDVGAPGARIRWRLHSQGYAFGRLDGRYVFLHRLVMEAPEGAEVDHINGDRLDNRRRNLRLVTRSVNSRNAYHDRAYRGAYLHKASGLWHAGVKVEGRTISLGYYRTREAAAEVARSWRVAHGWHA